MNDIKKYKRPESVLVVVYAKTGEVLMLRRKFPDEFWQSVTGSLEWGEGVHEAAVRELYEETGLDGASLIDCNSSHEFEIYTIWRDRYAPGVTQNREHVFLLPLDTCEPIEMDNKEHCEYQWVSREEAIQLATSHTNGDAISQWVPDLNAS